MSKKIFFLIIIQFNLRTADIKKIQSPISDYLSLNVIEFKNLKNYFYSIMEFKKLPIHSFFVKNTFNKINKGIRFTFPFPSETSFYDKILNQFIVEIQKEYRIKDDTEITIQDISLYDPLFFNKKK
jgi:hypothetical protein